MGEARNLAFSASLSALAGYLFIHTSYYRRYLAASVKTERYALYLVGWSFVAFVLGQIVAELGVELTPAWLIPARNDIYATGIGPPVINSLLVAFVCGVLDNAATHFRMRDEIGLNEDDLLKTWRMAAVALFVRKSNDAALRVLYRATMLQKPVMVTLKSLKVYVGIPYMLPWEDPTKELTYLKILPVCSGYRDLQTKKVTLSTRYKELKEKLAPLEPDSADDGVTEFAGGDDPTDPLISDMVGLKDKDGKVTAELDLNDIGIVVVWECVESLTIFDEDLYHAFQGQEPGPSDKTNLLDQLSRLEQLQKSGTLTAPEFEHLKKQIIGPV